MKLLLTLLLLLSVKCSCRPFDQDCVMIVTAKEKNESSTTSFCANYTQKLRPLRVIFTSQAITTLLVNVATLRAGYKNNLEMSNATISCKKIIGAVGNVGIKTARILDTIASRSNFNLTIVAAVSPSTGFRKPNLALPNVLDMNPLSHYIEATVSFIDQWNWTRIGIIYDHHHPFVARSLLNQLRMVNKTVTPIIALNKPKNRFRTLRRFKEYGTHITVLIMHVDYVCSLLKQAVKLNLTWPQYAWIVLSNDPQALDCKAALEGVFLLTPRCKSNFSEPISDHRKVQGYIRYRKTLCDSVLAVALSQYRLRALSNLTYRGLTGPVKFRDGKRLENISIVQSLTHSLEEISCYNSEFQQLNTSLDLSASADFPQGTTRKVVVSNTSKAGIVIISLLFTVSIILMTVSLILYLWFCNEPEVKATSVSVSMCMYLGCYLTLLFIPFLLIEQQSAYYTVDHRTADFVCNVQFWFGSIGLPVLLIVTSLLIKLARVYVIFMNPFSFKKRLCSDAFLFLLILLIVFPQILMLTMMTAIHPFKKIVCEITKKNHIRIVSKCRSDHGPNWIYSTAAYVFVVTICLMIITFKSSKIRHKRFKDTKATNAFAFLNLLILVSLIFSDIDSSFFVVKLYSIHLVLPIACQLLLFVPKIYPPLRRRFINGEVKSKHHHNNY